MWVITNIPLILNTHFLLCFLISLIYFNNKYTIGSYQMVDILFV